MFLGDWLGQWPGQWWGGEPTGPVSFLQTTLEGASAEFVGTVENPAEPEQEGGQGGGSGGQRDDALPLRGGSILSDADYRRTPAQIVDDALSRIRRPDRINADGTVTTSAPLVVSAALAPTDTGADDYAEAAAAFAAYLAMDD